MLSMFITILKDFDIEIVPMIKTDLGSVVKGNIKTANIRIADNVEFDGDVEMLEDIPSVEVYLFSDIIPLLARDISA